MADHRRATTILSRLSKMGVRLSIDDFGTGYSSLQYLQELPVDAIKIDKSFVMEMQSDAGSATIVQSTIDLGHNLELEVVAEGVENLEIYNKLSALGCDYAQGYFLSRPLSPDKASVWLEVFSEIKQTTKKAERVEREAIAARNDADAMETWDLRPPDKDTGGEVVKLESKPYVDVPDAQPGQGTEAKVLPLHDGDAEPDPAA